MMRTTVAVKSWAWGIWRRRYAATRSVNPWPLRLFCSMYSFLDE